MTRKAKPARKLQLEKATLRQLDAAALGQVAGGARGATTTRNASKTSDCL